MIGSPSKLQICLISCLPFILVNPDHRSWLLESLGLYSIKSFMKFLIRPQIKISFPLHNIIWKSKVLPKYKVFSWSIALNRLNTNDRRQWRRPYKLYLQICVLCIWGVVRLMIICSYIAPWHLWSSLYAVRGEDGCISRNIQDMCLIRYEGFGRAKDGRMFWSCGVFNLL